MSPPQPLRTGDAYNPDCPTRHILDRIGDKWAVLVLLTLKDGPVRFNDLRRRIGAISQKMLSQTLKSLERDGLVSRAAFPTVPVTVEYRLTPLAGGLIGILDQVTQWAEAHVGAIMASRRPMTGRWPMRWRPSFFGLTPFPNHQTRPLDGKSLNPRPARSPPIRPR